MGSSWNQPGTTQATKLASEMAQLVPKMATVPLKTAKLIHKMDQSAPNMATLGSTMARLANYE